MEQACRIVVGNLMLEGLVRPGYRGILAFGEF